MEIAGWDLRLKKKTRERKKEEKERRRKRERNIKKKDSLDEWILSKLGRQKDQFSLQSLLCKTLRSFAS